MSTDPQYQTYTLKILWETSGLKLAVLNELRNCRTKPQDGIPCDSEAAANLIEIFRCWDENLGWNSYQKDYDSDQDSSGRVFLIHILKSKYVDDLTFACLVSEDDSVAQTLKKVANCFDFFMLLGEFRRVACGTAITGEKSLHIERTEFSLDELVGVNGVEVDIYPRVSERDLVEEEYSNNLRADMCNYTKKAIRVQFISIGSPQ